MDLEGSKMRSVIFGLGGAQSDVKATSEHSLAAIFEKALEDSTFRDSMAGCKIFNIWPPSGVKWLNKIHQDTKASFLCDKERMITPEDIATAFEQSMQQEPRDLEATYYLFSWYTRVLESLFQQGGPAKDITQRLYRSLFFEAWYRICIALTEWPGVGKFQEWIRADDRFRQIAKKLLEMRGDGNVDRPLTLPRLRQYGEIRPTYLLLHRLIALLGIEDAKPLFGQDTFYIMEASVKEMLKTWPRDDAPSDWIARRAAASQEELPALEELGGPEELEDP